MEKKKDTLFVGVIYNTYPEALQFLKSTESFRNDHTLVVLVDNSESVPSAQFSGYLTKNPEIVFLRSGANLGYFHGASKGLEYFRKLTGTLPLWTIVGNVDIEFSDPEMIEKIGHFESVPDLGVIAPSIISDRFGTDFNPKIMVRYTFGKMKFYNVLYSCMLFSNLYQGLSYMKKILQRLTRGEQVNSFREPVEIYAPHGSCIIFHENYFGKGGTLNHISFLFGEEIFVAETAIKLGLKVIYVPGIRISDHEHASTGLFLSNRMNRLYLQSTRDLIRHYYQKS